MNFTAPQIAAAIDVEAAAWAMFFEITDPAQIESRKAVMRANVSVFGYIEPLLPFLPDYQEGGAL